MSYALNILFDDGPLIEIGSHEVSGGADHLHAARMSLVIGFCSFETGQKAVMDVDTASRERGREWVGENLHVSRKYNEIGARLCNERQDLRLLLALAVPPAKLRSAK